MRILTVLLMLGALCVGPLLIAQRGLSYQPWGWGGYGYNHASTAAQGAMMGASDVIRSAGAANLMNSMAASNFEDARSKYIDNRLKGTKTYFEMKQYNKQYRDANKAPRPTSEQLFRLAKEATPKSLGANELDPVTGKIDWPAVLETEDFAEYRKTLDDLYAERAQAAGQITIDQYKAIRAAIGDLQLALKQKVNDLPPQMFAQASAFVKRLEYSAQLSG